MQRNATVIKTVNKLILNDYDYFLISLTEYLYIIFVYINVLLKFNPLIYDSIVVRSFFFYTKC